jgi:hypothetical protein
MTDLNHAKAAIDLDALDRQVSETATTATDVGLLLVHDLKTVIAELRADRKEIEQLRNTLRMEQAVHRNLVGAVREWCAKKDRLADEWLLLDGRMHVALAELEG